MKDIVNNNNNNPYLQRVKHSADYSSAHIMGPEVWVGVLECMDMAVGTKHCAGLYQMIFNVDNNYDNLDLDS